MGANPFSAAAGYNNLSQGNWSPVVFSKKALKFFRTVSVVEEITNTDFLGEIKGQGSEVEIIKEPLMSTQRYKRGTKLVTQDLNDENLVLVIDQGIATQFVMDDIEKAFSHIGWVALAQGSAGYALRNEFDQEVLEFMLAGATQGTGTGTDATTVSIGFDTGDDFTPLNYILRFKRLLDENDVIEIGRWFTATPEFYEALGQEDSKLVDVSVMGDDQSMILRAMKMGANRMVHGFTLFQTNNQPTSITNSRITVLAGHTSAVSTATAMTESETIRAQDTFGDIYRSLLVYGRGIVRPEALFMGHITINL